MADGYYGGDVIPGMPKGFISAHKMKYTHDATVMCVVCNRPIT